MNTPKIADQLPKDRMVEYPFPIRDGLCCFFEVPRDLTKEEVERIHQYLLTLTTE